MSVVIGSPEPISGLATGAEVPRIYLLQPARGIGLGKRMINEAERYACAHDADHLWLDAMKAAPWAWKTYRKWGFEEIGETLFPGAIKSEFKPMIVMRRAITVAD